MVFQFNAQDRALWSFGERMTSLFETKGNEWTSAKECVCVRKREGFNGGDRDRDREGPVETELLHGPKGKHDTREITKMKVEEMICRGPRRG